MTWLSYRADRCLAIAESSHKGGRIGFGAEESAARGIGDVPPAWRIAMRQIRQRTGAERDRAERSKTRDFGGAGARQVRNLDFRLHALSISVAAALLAGCGGQAVNSVPPVNAAGKSVRHSKTFRYTGAEQQFTVPHGVSSLTIIASGASGEQTEGPSENGTPGGRIRAMISVTPGEALVVFVGGEGGLTYGEGGFNGGGSGDCEPSRNECFSGGGGGASDVRQGGDQLSNRVIVAGGGGGWGGGAAYVSSMIGGVGGLGGGKTAGAGEAGAVPPYGEGGGGGTQSYGGQGGLRGSASGGCNTDGSNGELGIGGAGGAASYCAFFGGGGGGGGYYGGGGGGSGGFIYPQAEGTGGGGGGGSSFVEHGAKYVRDQRGKAAPGNGLVVIKW
jgi:hypothetical protein